MSSRVVPFLLLFVAGCTRRASFDELQRTAYENLREGNLQVAAARADEGLRRSEEAREAAWVCRFQVLRAEVLAEDRRNAEALGLLDAAASRMDRTDPAYARALMTRGRIRCLSKGGSEELRKARADLDDARRRAVGPGFAALSAEIARHQGTCAWAQGDFALAEARYRESLDGARSVGQLFLESKATNNLGLVRVATGRYDEATDWLNRAVELATRLKSDLDAVKNLTNLGWCYYRLGDYERALEYLTRAQKLAVSRGYAAEQVLALQNLGNVHYRLRTLDLAARDYEKALAVAREIEDTQVVAELVTNLSYVALEQGRFDEADRYVSEAIRIDEQTEDFAGKQHSLQAEGEIWEGRGEHSRAEARYREVVASPHTQGELRWEAQARLAGLLVKLKRPAQAEAAFLKAFATMDASRAELRQADHKITFFSSLGRFYDDYVGFLVAEGKERQALEVADYSRARLLREMLESEQELPRATASRFQETARQLDAAILFYWLGPARSYLWKVTSRGVELHELPSELEISEQAEAYLARILQGRDPIAEGAPEPEWLYRTLVGPASLAAGSRVVFVPDGVLHQLNPETFVVPSPKPHYWIEDVTLATAPSVSILGARGRVAPPRESVRRILLIGDPEPVGVEFPRLVHARGELERIAGKFPLAMRAVYTGSTAEPAAYRASEPGRFAYIHFAAHAQANRQVPLESAVILSPRNDLSKLYAREIVGLPLRAELVTLSACRGAGAREFAGEGLVGLTWAFLSSGAGNVIAGLWNVEDASTADLMTGLYGRLAKGEGPAEALRQAKLELRRADPAYAKPYYWAPFVTYTRGSVRRP